MTDNKPTYPYRFERHQIAEWKAYLAEHGFVVVADALSPEQNQQVVDEMLDVLCELSDGKLDKQKPKTWSVAKNYPFMLHGGMIQYVGHAGFQWTTRAATAPIFADIWEVKPEELATSFDGFTYMDARRKYQPKETNSFLHSDQSPTKDFLWSVQGLVNLFDCDEESGGLVVLPGSHKWHQSYFVEKGLQALKDDWYVVPEEDKKEERFQPILKVCGKAGDMMLWDSRTFHCNCLPKNGKRRGCVYVCQIPKSRISPQICTKRRQAWEEKRTTNHYPGNDIKLFPRLPRYAEPELASFVPAVSLQTLDTTQQKLAYLQPNT
jgi:ectoine hydroxylase-related dioxygenase (phytanoyl-CoA dioxygenase family)